MYSRYCRIFILLLWALLGTFNAAAEDVVAEEVSTGLRQLLASEAPIQHKRTLPLHSAALVKEFYDQRDYRPAWLSTNHPLPAAHELVALVVNARSEGLQPADYHHQQLYTLLEAVTTNASVAPLDWAELDVLLTDAWLTYGTHLLRGRLDPEATGRGWAIPTRSQALAALLQGAVTRADTIRTLTNLAPKQVDYRRLKAALARYRALEAQGGWPPVSAGATLRRGDQHPRVKELRARLQVSGELALLSAAPTPATTETNVLLHEAMLFNPEMVFDQSVFEAVRRFQKRHGLTEDGIVGPRTLEALNVPISKRVRQLELNLERWRWLPDEFGNRYILVNITDYKMTVVENGQSVMEAEVIVGRPKRPTPVLTSEISYLVLNPDWYVPHSIAVKDKLPQLRRNPYAFSKSGMHIYNVKGQKIDPATIDWQRVTRANFNYRLRQDPGPQNALGKVKFIFPNPYHVYLHDTPSQGLFNRTKRDLSSGCIRVSNPIELTHYLLKDEPQWTRNAILGTLQSRRQRRISLPEKIPVYLLYWTAWVDAENVVQFREDIYGHDTTLADSLKGSLLPSRQMVFYDSGRFR